MDYLFLAIVWISYLTLHSFMISTTVTEFLEQKLGDKYRFYRLFYNLVSIVLLIPVVMYSIAVKEEPFFIWDGYLAVVRYILFSTGILLFILGFRQYSMTQFLGLAQIRKGSDHGLLNTSGKLDSTGILGFIRHPFYTAVFPLFWARDLDNTRLITNIIISIYLIVGTILEERKLILEFGDEYREYKKQVSMFLPIKWIKKKFNR